MLVSLERIATKDGITLDGAVADAKGKKRVGVLFMHGLTSTFSRTRALWQGLAEMGKNHGIGVAAFNTRGHDIVVGYRRKRPGEKRRRHVMLGAAFENFKDCIYDIRTGVRFLKKRGYRTIILVGHSTGSQKSLYYLSQTRDRNVKGLVLAGPVSDISVRRRELGHGFTKNIAAAKRFMKRSGGRTLLPPSITKEFLSAQRYVSLFSPGSPEDVFPYYNPKAEWTALRRIKTPTLVIFGGKDEYLDRSAKETVKTFLAHAPARSRLVTAVIKSAGHNFRGKEKDFANAIMRWITLEFRV